MSTMTQAIPTGQDHLMAHLVCDPCADAITFYAKALGAEEIHRMPAPDGKRLMHAAMRVGKSIFS